MEDYYLRPVIPTPTCHSDSDLSFRGAFVKRDVGISVVVDKNTCLVILSETT